MTYNYNSTDLVKPVELTEREQFLLKDSKTFCIYPWIHLHAYPTGEVYPCCHAEMKPGVVGNCRTNTLEEIWQDTPMQNLRTDMLSETPNAACTRCYEQEESGFFSGRRSANKHHGQCHDERWNAEPRDHSTGERTDHSANQNRRETSKRHPNQRRICTSGKIADELRRQHGRERDQTTD